MRMGMSPSQMAAKRAINWRAAMILFDGGWTIAQIARHYDCHYRTAFVHLKALGAKHRSSPAWHSFTARRIYTVWQTMRRRCNSPSHPSFRHYGGQGIGIAPDWEQFEPFHDWATSSGYRVGKCLILIDHDRDYGPDNCRWGGRKERQEQRASRTGPRKSSCMISAWGEVKNMEEWARDPRCKVSGLSLGRRLRGGAAAEAAMTTPPRRRWDPPLPKARRAPMRSATPVRVDWDKVIHLHRERGRSVKQIAAELGLSYSGVVSGLKDRNAFQSSLHTQTPDRHRLYILWRSLRDRTANKAHHLYGSNGALGVKLCREWQDFEVFLRWALDNGSQPNLCLFRIVRSGPFSPANCRWITRSENTKRAMRRLGGRVRK